MSTKWVNPNWKPVKEHIVNIDSHKQNQDFKPEEYRERYIFPEHLKPKRQKMFIPKVENTPLKLNLNNYTKLFDLIITHIEKVFAITIDCIMLKAPKCSCEINFISNNKTYYYCTYFHIRNYNNEYVEKNTSKITDYFEFLYSHPIGKCLKEIEPGKFRYVFDDKTTSFYINLVFPVGWITNISKKDQDHIEECTEFLEGPDYGKIYYEMRELEIEDITRNSKKHFRSFDEMIRLFKSSNLIEISYKIAL